MDVSQAEDQRTQHNSTAELPGGKAGSQPMATGQSAARDRGRRSGGGGAERGEAREGARTGGVV